MEPEDEADAIERAINLLGRRGDRRRPFLRREIRRIVEQYREAKRLDDEPVTTSRTARLDALARLDHATRGLHASDALSVILAAGLPADALERIARASREIAGDMPPMSGRVAGQALPWFARECVELFARNGDRDPTATATGPFLTFLGAVHDIASPDRGADVSRPGRDAVRWWRERSAEVP